MAYDDGDARWRDDPATAPPARARRAEQNPFAADDYVDDPRPLLDEPDDEPGRYGGLAILTPSPRRPERDDHHGRGHLLAHLVCEAALLVAAAVVAALIYRRDPSLLSGDARQQLMVAVGGLGLLALAAGLSLRAGVVNLAVGPIALAAAIHVAEQGDRGIAIAGGGAVVAAAVGGLAMGALVAGLQVPGWAASLGVGFAAMTFVAQRDAPVTLQGGFEPTAHAVPVLAAVAGLTAVGGLLAAIPAVRRQLGRFRSSGDPAQRPGLIAGLVVVVALGVSSALAAAGGMLLASGAGEPVAPGTGIEWTGLAVGAALLGGVSAFGRRGGVVGTFLAVVLITLVLELVDRGRFASPFAVAAGALLLGLVVTRVVERFGRPWAVEPDDAEGDAPPRNPPPRDRVRDSWPVRFVGHGGRSRGAHGR
ncbi:ABC transporter permease [Pilimelia columellifera]|uniref:ABC transporter permease n=1 Tax=Pilimelia columellifera subsp. columellifera TaxID=706583 RepID=A0ABP6AMS4_9ACTN